MVSVKQLATQLTDGIQSGNDLPQSRAASTVYHGLEGNEKHSNPKAIPSPPIFKHLFDIQRTMNTLTQRIPFHVILMCALVVWLISGTACRHTDNKQPKDFSPGTAISPRPTEDSGGTLDPMQARFDVQHIDLDLKIDPKRNSISGTARLSLLMLETTDSLLLDLDSRFKINALKVRSTEQAEIPSRFAHSEGALYIRPSITLNPSQRIHVEVAYQGKPQEAERAPWDGGFTWTETEDGHPWIATTVQGEGGDLWFPCKDHPSDKPESVDLHITVPDPLVVAANGKLISTERHSNKWSTYHWQTHHPISNYNLALNIGPYEVIDSTYTSVDGTEVPFLFWVLPSSREKAEQAVPEFKRHLNFYERWLGPYPFRDEKYGIVETPHLGMEHQTIIAYGNQFRGGPHGYDWLHHHELGHEWWGNLVTADDWAHFWLHEGTCTYMQMLYAEERQGAMAYHHGMYTDRKRIKSEFPMVPNQATSIDTIDEQLGVDMYFKGSWILHTLRYLIGKEHLQTCLRRFNYPDPSLETNADGSAIHFSNTKDFIGLVEEVSGQDLQWFFDVYLKQAALPKLIEKREGDEWTIQWDVPEGHPFPMPLEIEKGGEIKKYPMNEGRLTIPVHSEQVLLDPNNWILKERRSVLLGNPYEETFD